MAVHLDSEGNFLALDRDHLKTILDEYGSVKLQMEDIARKKIERNEQAKDEFR